MPEKFTQDKFSYFIDRTERDFDELKSDMNVLHEKIDKLWNFRALLMGFSMAISGLTAIIIDIVLVYFEVRKH